MQNLLTSQQIRDADAHTISTKPISSLDLMEAASNAFIKAFENEVPDNSIPISIYCGTGNNGGDGLAVARLLFRNGYKNVHVIIGRFSDKITQDFTANLERLKHTEIQITEFSEIALLPEATSEVLIDALLGSGLNKPVEGKLKKLINHINSLHKKVISIDVPSGFPSEGSIKTSATIIKARLVISFQRPNINFFFPESGRVIERFKVVTIGLDEDYIQSLPSHWKLVSEEDIEYLLKARKSFSHKGTYGHALIIGGSQETMGAALLCADACLHSGAGLTTACIPESGFTALNIRSPEIMAIARNNFIPISMSREFSSIAIGPGLGTNDEALLIVRSILSDHNKPVVLDADALNILAMKPELFKHLPAMSILTPHMKEFDRMFGEHHSWWERVDTARQRAIEFNIVILLKNQYSFIVLPNGNVLINPTGNPAMAVGGMGDVLTGIIVSFLAQGYPAEEAAMIACFIHGKAGDELKNEGMNSIPPGKLVECLPFVISKYSSQFATDSPPASAGGEQHGG
ncbi:NAD(P)H-hydrate dehydratase [Daejeonella sp.]|uniref:NAD(P)H-hydrate dehydratase n=1 Tax=Daejeonella sp. TaxID=2805397 RepID=UPI00398327CC